VKATKPATTRILLLLGNPLYEKPIVQVIGDLRESFGEAISVKYHLILDEGSAARLDRSSVEKDIRDADIILLDKMSSTAARESDTEQVISLMEKYKNGKTTLGLSVPGPIMARITNMGSFSSDSLSGKPEGESGLKRIGAIFSPDSVSFSSEGLKVKRSWLSPAARLLQFGKSKPIQNYIKIYRYWEFGDRGNMLNLILFLAHTLVFGPEFLKNPHPAQNTLRTK